MLKKLSYQTDARIFNEELQLRTCRYIGRSCKMSMGQAGNHVELDLLTFHKFRAPHCQSERLRHQIQSNGSSCHSVTEPRNRKTQAAPSPTCGACGSQPNLINQRGLHSISGLKIVHYVLRLNALAHRYQYTARLILMTSSSGPKPLSGLVRANALVGQKPVAS